MPVETIEFQDGRTLQHLLGRDLEHLKQVQARIPAGLVSRDGWVRVDGSEQAIGQVRRILQQLETAWKGGLGITTHEVDLAIEAALSREADGLETLLGTRIVTSPKKPAIIPKTHGQQQYVRHIQKHDIVFGIGPAGTGKTYLAMAMAVAALKSEQVNRIILTRPAVEAGEALGFLPGDLKEKIAPYLRPLYDALHEMLEVEEAQKYLERGIVEVAPLAYMRGRTLNRAFVILDEAQNTTTEQMFMFLTRLGMDSKCVVTGDDTQIDLPGNKRSGLIEARHALKRTEGVAFMFFEPRDVVRHPLVQSIVRAYRDYRGRSPD